MDDRSYQTHIKFNAMSNKLIIQDHKVISWNKLYQQKHWSYRKELADTIHNLVFFLAKQQKIKPVKKKIDIYIQAYQTRTIDSDNICAKLYIDGLKFAKIIKDDTPKYVGKVTLESIKSKQNSISISWT